MKVLFVHQNFPAQFLNAARYFAEQANNEVVAIGMEGSHALPNVRLLRYAIDVETVYGVHPFARRFDMECRRAEQVAYVLVDLERTGFEPDLVFVHCGWGENIPVRALFPHTKIVAYCEYFYNEVNSDVDFDAEFGEMTRDGAVALRVKNAATLLSLAEADIALSPTLWQRSTFPRKLQSLIDVCHEGVDVDVLFPNEHATFRLPDDLTLDRTSEVVTYVARNLEPLRGYHRFMRALPRILRERPQARVVIVGGHGVSYGPNPPAGQTWKDHFLSEVRDELDLSRIYFVGRLRYADYVNLLRVSSAHVYFTYPFVLSWSLLEAMAIECHIIASSTAPVREVIDGSNGVLVDFFNQDQLSSHVITALRRGDDFQAMRGRARATIIERYSRKSCLEHLISLTRR